MGKLIDLISGGVERIAEASANKSGRGNGGHSVGFSQTQRQTQQTYGSYNNEHYDAPSSYSQGSQGNQVAYEQNDRPYTDPNHPQPHCTNRFPDRVNGDGFLGVPTGGAIRRPPCGDRKSDRRERMDRRRGKGSSSSSSSSDYDHSGRRQKRVGLIGSLKGVMGAPPEAQGRGGLLSMATRKIGGAGSGGGSREVEESDGQVAELDGSQKSPCVAELEGGMGQRSSNGGFRSETYGEDHNRRK